MVGDRCRHWGEESGKKSTVVGDQRDKQEWKRRTALRQACKSRKFDRRRLFNPDIKEYTLSKRNPFAARRLDYIWTSSTVFDKTRVQYYFGPSVSHRGCGIAILLSEVVKGPGYWKFNNSLLEDITYVNQMNEEIDSFIR